MQVFISHARGDDELARKLATQLTDAGLNVWNPDEVEPGDNWARKVGQALDDSDLMVVLATPEGLASDAVQHNIDYALFSKKMQHRLISVAVGSVREMPWILRKQPVVQMGSPDEDIAPAVQEIVELSQKDAVHPTEVFLSHSSQDLAMATAVTDQLVRHGVPVFYSPRNILGAQQWHDEIGEALARCDWFLVLLSPDAVISKWVRRELRYALRHEYENRIVPLLYRACDIESLSWTLPDFQMVDFAGDFNAGCRELLRIWGIGFRSQGD